MSIGLAVVDVPVPKVVQTDTSYWIGQSVAFGAAVAAKVSAILGLEEDPAGIASGIVVVAEHGSRRAALVVSSVDGVEDVIVRPISASVPRSPFISGAAELPGGALALVLDPSLLLDSIFEGEAA